MSQSQSKTICTLTKNSRVLAKILLSTLKKLCGNFMPGVYLLLEDEQQDYSILLYLVRNFHASALGL